MARQTYETTGRGWLPEEYDSNVIKTVQSGSAIEKLARRVTMSGNSKVIPRGGGIGVGIVGKGSAYAEETTSFDEVTLIAKKIGSVVRIAEEDIDDSPIAIVEDRKTEWASAYARFIDNACLAVNAAVGTGVPFLSVYRSLTTANAATGYVANANRIATVGALTFDHLSAALGKHETSRYFDRAKTVIIANPSFRASIRGLKDGSGRYIFAESPRQDEADTLFGLPIEWSLGAAVSTTATDRPTGNPLMFFVNRDLLILGVRSGPESVVIDGRDGVSALTDEFVVKMRARRAFILGHEAGAVVIELTTV